MTQMFSNPTIMACQWPGCVEQFKDYGDGNLYCPNHQYAARKLQDILKIGKIHPNTVVTFKEDNIIVGSGKHYESGTRDVLPNETQPQLGGERQGVPVATGRPCPHRLDWSGCSHRWCSLDSPGR